MCATRLALSSRACAAHPSRWQATPPDIREFRSPTGTQRGLYTGAPPMAFERGAGKRGAMLERLMVHWAGCALVVGERANPRCARWDRTDRPRRIGIERNRMEPDGADRNRISARRMAAHGGARRRALGL